MTCCFITSQATRLLNALGYEAKHGESIGGSDMIASKGFFQKSVSLGIPRVRSTPQLSPSASTSTLSRSSKVNEGFSTPTPGTPKGPGTPTSAGARRSFVREVLLRIGEVLTSSIESPILNGVKDLRAVEGAETVFAVTSQRLALLRALAKADEKEQTWAPIIKDLVMQALKTVPTVLEGMERAIKKELKTGLPPREVPADRLLTTAVIAFLGGHVGGISVGASVLVELADKKGVYEEGKSMTSLCVLSLLTLRG